MFQTHYNKETKLWSGNDSQNLYNSRIRVSLAQVLLEACKTRGSKIAQVIQIIKIVNFICTNYKIGNSDRLTMTPAFN